MSFYASLPVIDDLDTVMRPESYSPLPDEWHIALCDVRNSTAAVSMGQYKGVNSLGAAAITAVLNAAGDTEIPFSFEGDGCVLCVPPELLEATRAALAKTQQIARQSFDLELRIGTVPAGHVRRLGATAFVARYRVSDNYVQAAFAGGGIACAEKLLKDPVTSAQFAIDPGSVVPMGSLEGFQCRWEDIPSRYGETVSLMVRVHDAEPGPAVSLYREVIAKVREIYGDDAMSHPLAAERMRLTLDGSRLGVEARIRAAGRGAFGRWLWTMAARVAVLCGRVAMKYGLRARGADWGSYRAAVIRNADVRKFSDVFRQILSGTTAQREALSAWLEERYRKGELVYGLHVSDRAHMTCLVFDYSGRHVHFIDGADGGLFLAAKAYKERAARLAAPRASHPPAAPRRGFDPQQVRKGPPQPPQFRHGGPVAGRHNTRRSGRGR